MGHEIPDWTPWFGHGRVVRGNGFRRDMYGVEATRMVGFGVRFTPMSSLPFVAGLLRAGG